MPTTLTIEETTVATTTTTTGGGTTTTTAPTTTTTGTTTTSGDVVADCEISFEQAFLLRTWIGAYWVDDYHTHAIFFTKPFTFDWQSRISVTPLQGVPDVVGLLPLGLEWANIVTLSFGYSMGEEDGPPSGSPMVEGPGNYPVGMIKSTNFFWCAEEIGPLYWIREPKPRVRYLDGVLPVTIPQDSGAKCQTPQWFKIVDIQPSYEVGVGTQLISRGTCFFVDSEVGIGRGEVNTPANCGGLVSATIEVEQSGLRSVTQEIYSGGSDGTLYANDQFNIYKYVKNGSGVWVRSTFYSTPVTTDSNIRATIKCIRWISPYNVLLIALSDVNTEASTPDRWLAVSAFNMEEKTFVGTAFEGDDLVEVGGMAVYTIYPPEKLQYQKNYMYAQHSHGMCTAVNPDIFDVDNPVAYAHINNEVFRFELLDRAQINTCSTSLVITPVLPPDGLYTIDLGVHPGARFYQPCPAVVEGAVIRIGVYHRWDLKDRVELAQVSALARPPEQWLAPVIAEAVVGDQASNLLGPWVQVERFVDSNGTTGYVSFVIDELPVLGNLWPSMTDAAESALGSFDPLNAPLDVETEDAKVADIGVDRSGGAIVMAYERGELHYMSGPQNPTKVLKIVAGSGPSPVSNGNLIKSLSVVPHAIFFSSDMSVTTPEWEPPITQEISRLCAQPDIFKLQSALTHGHPPFVGDSQFFAIEDSDPLLITRTGEHAFNCYAVDGTTYTTPQRNGATVPTQTEYMLFVSVDIEYQWDPAIDGVIGVTPDFELRYEYTDPLTAPISHVIAANLFSNHNIDPYGGKVRVSTVIELNAFNPGATFRFVADLNGDANKFDRYTFKYSMAAVDKSVCGNKIRWFNRRLNGGEPCYNTSTLVPTAGITFLLPSGSQNLEGTIFTVAVDLWWATSVSVPATTATITAELFDHITGDKLGDVVIPVSVPALNAGSGFTPTATFDGSAKFKQTFSFALVPGITNTPGDTTYSDVGSYTDLRIKVKVLQSEVLIVGTHYSMTYSVGVLEWKSVNSTLSDVITGYPIMRTGLVSPVLVGTSRNGCPAIGVAFNNSTRHLLTAPDIYEWPPQVRWVEYSSNFPNETSSAGYGNRARMGSMTASGRYLTTVKKNLYFNTDVFEVGFYRVTPPNIITITPDPPPSTSTTTSTTSGEVGMDNWVYVAREDEIVAFKDVQTQSLQLANDEIGYGIAVADGPRVYFTTVSGTASRLYWAPMDLSTSHLLATYQNSKITDIAWDWNQQKLVLQDELAKRIFMVDHNASFAGVVADADTPPYLGEIFGHMEVNPKSSLLYHNAAYSAPYVDVYTNGIIQGPRRYPSLIDLTKTIDSLPADVEGDNTWHKRLFHGAANAQPFQRCLINPVAHSFRPIRDLQSLSEPTTTTTTTVATTTTGGTTTTTTGTGTTTTTVATTTTGGTTTTVATTTTILGTTSGDTGCWEATSGVEMYPLAGVVRINRSENSVEQIYQLINDAPAAQLVFSVTFNVVLEGTSMIVATAAGFILERLMITAPGTYRLKFTLQEISNIRVGVQVSQGVGGGYTEIESASLRACDE